MCIKKCIDFSVTWRIYEIYILCYSSHIMYRRFTYIANKFKHWFRRQWIKLYFILDSEQSDEWWLAYIGFTCMCDFNINKFLCWLQFYFLTDFRNAHITFIIVTNAIEVILISNTSILYIMFNLQSSSEGGLWYQIGQNCISYTTIYYIKFKFNTLVT